MSVGELERLGIYEKAQRKRVTYARWLNRRVLGPPSGKPSRRMSAGLQAEIDAIVKAALERQREELSDLQTTRPTITIRLLIECAARVTGMGRDELLGYRRARSVAWPRHFAMWLVKEKRPDLSLPTIGKAFNRDHTTIMHGLKRVAAMREEAPFKQWLAHPDVLALLAVTP